MDLNEKLDSYNKIVEGINKYINKLINEQEEGEPASSEPLSSKSYDDDRLSKSADELIKLGKQLFHDKTKSMDEYGDEPKSGTILLHHGDIKFKGDFDGKEISSKQSAKYYVSDIEKTSDGTLLTLNAKNNVILSRNVGDNVALMIKIPYSEGINYENDFVARLLQINTDNKEREELDNVTMRIVSHNIKK